MISVCRKVDDRQNVVISVEVKQGDNIHKTILAVRWAI